MARELKESSACPTGVIARIERLRAIPAEEVESLTRALRKAFADRSPRVREEAIQIAIKANLGEFEPQVLALLSDKNNFVRYRTIEYLGLIHEGEGIRATWLYPSLEDPNDLARIETLESLMQTKIATLYPVLRGFSTMRNHWFARMRLWPCPTLDARATESQSSAPRHERLKGPFRPTSPVLYTNLETSINFTV